MDTAGLKKFSQLACESLIEQVGSKLEFVLKPESSARREYPMTVNQLEKAMAAQGKADLIDQVAYTWFNRFCALRFMDANGYNRVGVVSPTEGQVQPEILAEAKSGVIDDSQINQKTANQIRGLLSGSISSPDAQGEAYRLLIVGSCNSLYKTMPFLFERIQDFTELLMPDDLLSENSVLTKMRGVMTTDACQDVEIIGWLYQFYISEKKDEVFAGLKKNQKITAENIPAATQLFTPHWIVRYLVENSLGRLWLLNRPQSRLAEQMDYYIAPEEPETDFLRIASPEDIRICDPAAGSGHMLTYAFDLLYAIYVEEGYDATEIPALILTHNLTGVEIDDRAGALAAFALAMKAAAKLGRRRFLRMEAKPDICVLQNVAFTEAEMQDVAAVVGKDLFTDELRETLGQFEQAKNFGSLIVPKLRDPAETLRVVEARDFGSDLLLKEVQERVIAVLRMAEALSPKYHVVVANPPYMGSRGMNTALSDFAWEKYANSRADLYAMFMERCRQLALQAGVMSIINMQSWMYLSSFETLRKELLAKGKFLTMAHLGERAFDSIGGAVVSTTAFIYSTSTQVRFMGDYLRLTSGTSEAQKSRLLWEAKADSSNEHRFRSCAEDFQVLPGEPIAYWVSDRFRDTFESPPLKEVAKVIAGITTGDTEHFIRQWSEVSFSKINLTPDDGNFLARNWIPYLKGSDGRKWYGNYFDVLNWKNQGSDLQRSGNTNSDLYFKECITFSRITTGDFSARFAPYGFLWDRNGPSIHPKTIQHQNAILGLMCSKTVDTVLEALAPTISKNMENISAIPVSEGLLNLDFSWVKKATEISKQDWDTREDSWQFSCSPIVGLAADKLQDAVNSHKAKWRTLADELHSIEIRNNSETLSVYGLEKQVDAAVSPEKVTLFNNAKCRLYHGENSSLDGLANLLVTDFLSYAVGCMFGRYSLDAPGLILANQGERLEDYLAQVPTPTFEPDEDNVIPMIDFEGDWFQDDISERFKQFLRITFGDEYYTQNLAFIENALGKSIQKYFVKDFYTDHVKRYKKRPIYWQVSSPRGTFNALFYMHRYRSDTISVVLNDYLREFRTKLEARKDSSEQISISISASQKEKTQALKMIDQLNRAINEVVDFERDILYPLAGQNITIDLDDGVKNNYPLFGTALKKVPGLS